MNKPTPVAVREFLRRFRAQIALNDDIDKWTDSYRRLHPRASEEELQHLVYAMTHQSYKEEALEMVESLLG